MEECKHAGACGGCLYQGVSYEEQVALKEKSVLELLEEKGIRCGEYLGFEGSPSVSAYRNKMEYTFGDEVKGGPLTLGMHRAGQYLSVVTVDGCQLVDRDFSLILSSVLDFCLSKGYRKYNKRSHKGLMRNLIIRKGERTHELLISIVTASADHISADRAVEGNPDEASAPQETVTFDDEGFLKLLLGLKLENTIAGVLHTYNDNISDKVTPERVELLYGRDYYREKIMGLDFQVSLFSFFQTNISAVERLYTEALELIDDVEGKTVFDLYCGTGTISQALALRAKEVVGVEIVEDAVEAARANASLNGLDNCRFIAGDVLTVLDQVEKKPDVIVVDPPRAGMNYKVLPKLLRYGVDQILYISCNPKTLMDNLLFMQENGYRVEKIKAYDNFPFTKHVETVCLLSNRKPDTKVRIDLDMTDYYRIKDAKKSQN